MSSSSKPKPRGGFTRSDTEVGRPGSSPENPRVSFKRSARTSRSHTTLIGPPPTALSKNSDAELEAEDAGQSHEADVDEEADTFVARRPSLSFHTDDIEESSSAEVDEAPSAPTPNTPALTLAAPPAPISNTWKLLAGGIFVLMLIQLLVFVVMMGGATEQVGALESRVGELETELEQRPAVIAAPATPDGTLQAVVAPATTTPAPAVAKQTTPQPRPAVAATPPPPTSPETQPAKEPAKQPAPQPTTAPAPSAQAAPAALTSPDAMLTEIRETLSDFNARCDGEKDIAMPLFAQRTSEPHRLWLKPSQSRAQPHGEKVVAFRDTSRATLDTLHQRAQDTFAANAPCLADLKAAFERADAECFGSGERHDGDWARSVGADHCQPR